MFKQIQCYARMTPQHPGCTCNTVYTFNNLTGYGMNMSVINLMRALGYPITKRGCCGGIAAMWQQAWLSGGQDEEYKFFERLDTVNQEYKNKLITPDNINDELNKVKDKVRTNQLLNKQEQFLLEMVAMFDGIALYQDPEAVGCGVRVMFSHPQESDIARVLSTNDILIIRTQTGFELGFCNKFNKYEQLKITEDKLNQILKTYDAEGYIKNDEHLQIINRLARSLNTQNTAVVSEGKVPIGTGLFVNGKIPKQRNIEQIATVASSQLLQDKGGIEPISSQAFACKKENLQEFFDDLKAIIGNDTGDISILLRGATHVIGLRYDSSRNSWLIIDPGAPLDDCLAYKKDDSSGDKLSLSEAISQNLYQKHETISQYIAGPLQADKNLVFNMMVYSSGNNPALKDMQQKFADYGNTGLEKLTQEQVKLSNGDMTRLHMAAKFNDRAFIKKYAALFPGEFQNNMAIAWEDIITKLQATPVDLAIIHGNMEILQIFIDNGALKLRDEDGVTPLFKRMLDNDWEAVCNILMRVTNKKQIDPDDAAQLDNSEIKEHLKKEFPDLLKNSNKPISCIDILNMKNCLKLSENDTFFNDIIGLLPKNHLFAIIHPLLLEIDKQNAYITPGQKIKVIERLVHLLQNPELCVTKKGTMRTYGDVIHFWERENWGKDKKLTSLDILKETPNFMDVANLFCSPAADGFLHDLKKNHIHTSIPKSADAKQTQARFKESLTLTRGDMVKATVNATIDITPNIR